MKYREIGSTGLRVSEIGFGTGGTAGLMIRGSFEEQLHTVARALELGINYFDESPDYGAGVSEQNLGRALRELKATPVITTKVEVRAEDLDDIARHVERSVGASLSRLGVDHVDVVQVHNGPARRRPELQGRDYRVLHIEDYLRTGGAIEGLQRIQRDGKARHVGFICRGDDGPEVRELIDTGVFSLINLVYTLLNPTAAQPQPTDGAFAPDWGQVIPYASSKGVGVAVYSPLGGGALTDHALHDAPPHPFSGAAARTGAPSPAREQELLRARRFAFLSRDGRTLAQAAARFALMQPGVTTVLGGFSDQAQLEEMVSAPDAGPLSDDDVARIEATWRELR